jgi:hypothetical protein
MDVVRSGQDLGYNLLHPHSHDHLLDLYDYPLNEEVDCSIFNCCSFIKTKMKMQMVNKNAR